MKETMSWRFIKMNGDMTAEFLCSWCYSTITLKMDDELPYCKHCGREPEDDSHTVAAYLKLQMCKSRKGACERHLCKQAVDVISLLVLEKQYAVTELNCLKVNLEESHLDIKEKQAEIERLKRRIESSDKQLEEMKEGNGRLYLRFNTAKNKAVKEFDERLSREISKIPQHHFSLLAVQAVIEKVKKEMAGE